jgi:hypothetical protein
VQPRGSVLIATHGAGLHEQALWMFFSIHPCKHVPGRTLLTFEEPTIGPRGLGGINRTGFPAFSSLMFAAGAESVKMPAPPNANYALKFIVIRKLLENAFQTLPALFVATSPKQRSLCCKFQSPLSCWSKRPRHGSLDILVVQFVAPRHSSATPFIDISSKDVTTASANLSSEDSFNTPSYSRSRGS